MDAELEKAIYFGKREKRALKEIIPRGGLYEYSIDKDGYLWQLWEKPYDRPTSQINGEIRVYEKSEYEGQPKERWPLLMSIGRLYYILNLIDDTARIMDVFVVDRFQKQGFGSKLIDIAEGRIKHYSIKKVGGSAVVEARDYWRKKGYTVANSEMQKAL